MLRYIYILFLLLLVNFTFSQINNPLLIKAKISFENGEYNKSILFYTSLIKSDLSKLESRMGRGQCYMNLGLTEKAIDDFLTVEKIKKNLASFYLAGCYSMQLNTNESIFWLKKYLNTKNKMPENKLKSHSYFKNLNNTREWEELWKTEWYSKYEISLNHASYLYNTNSTINALNELDELLDKKPKMHEAFFLRARIYNKLGQYKLAVKNCEQAIRFNRKNIYYLVYLSQNLYALENYKQALEVVNKSIDIAPNNINLYKERAIIYKELKEYSKAKSDLETYSSFKTSDFEAYYELGIINYELKDYLNALLSFSKSLELKPNNFNCFVARGNTYYKTNTFKYAERDYTMALDLNPRDGTIYYKRALARIKLDKPAKVCSDLKKATKLGVYEAEELFYKICD